MVSNAYRSLLAGVLLAALAGCGRDISDTPGDAPALDQWTAKIEKEASPKLDPMPEPVKFDPVPYSASGERDPFRPAVRADDPSQSGRPDPNRPRQMLERFALDALKMVGTIGSGGGRSGLVKAPDGIVYRVRAGQYLGQNDGRVTGVSEDRITLTETVRDGQGGWEPRAAEIVLEEP